MIRPIRDNIVVKPIEVKDFMNGVIVPPQYRKKIETAAKGEVLAVGPGTKDRIMKDIQVGMIAVFNKYAGKDIEYQGEKIKVIRLHEVIALK